MAFLLIWTIFSNLDGTVLKKEETPVEQNQEHIGTEDSAFQERDDLGDTSGETPSIPQVGLQQDDLAPDFTLSLIDGEEVSLSDLQGKKVILNFWATWCPPCRAEMPDMQRFYEQAAGEDVEILAVNLTESEKSREDIAAFLDEFGITFPIPLDEESEVAATYYAYAIPTTYFIDTTGTIQGKIIGPMNYDFMVKQVAQMD